MAPHAEKDTYAAVVNGDTSNNNDGSTVNGEKPLQSKVLSHLQSYPVVQDGLEFTKTNPYGAKFLSLFDETYQRVVAPFRPYLQTPYSYVSPYLSRADELGDSGLSKVDSTFPMVKEDTHKLKETVQAYASVPMKLAGQGKEYVMGTWQDEYKRTPGQEGVLRSVKALLSTELKIGIDSYKLMSEYWAGGKHNTEKKVDEVKK